MKRFVKIIDGVEYEGFDRTGSTELRDHVQNCRSCRIDDNGFYQICNEDLPRCNDVFEIALEWRKSKIEFAGIPVIVEEPAADLLKNFPANRPEIKMGDEPVHVARAFTPYPTCDTCAFWDDIQSQVGICGSVAWQMPASPKPDIALACTGFRTGPKFGCIHHKQKESK